MRSIGNSSTWLICCPLRSEQAADRKGTYKNKNPSNETNGHESTNVITNLSRFFVSCQSIGKTLIMKVNYGWLLTIMAQNNDDSIFTVHPRVLAGPKVSCKIPCSIQIWGLGEGVVWQLVNHRLVTRDLGRYWATKSGSYAYPKMTGTMLKRSNILKSIDNSLRFTARFCKEF